MTQQRQSNCICVDQTKMWVGCLSVHSRFEKLLQERNPDARNMCSTSTGPNLKFEMTKGPGKLRFEAASNASVSGL